ncbi:MAG: class I tRNA ligase family protein, partial [Thermoplasmata archaeon]
WHELADHYIEAAKFRLYKGPDIGVQYTIYNVGLGILKILAPILPHVTEELYQQCFKNFEKTKSLHITDWPQPIFDDSSAIEKGKIIVDVIAAVRRWKSGVGIPLNREIERIEIIAGPHEDLLKANLEDISATIKVKSVEFITDSDLEEQIVSIRPVHSKFGPKYRRDANAIIEHIKSTSIEKLISAFEKGDYEFSLPSGKNVKVSRSDFEFESEMLSHGKKVEALQVEDIVILIPS